MEHLDIFNLLREKFGEEIILEHVFSGDEEKGLRDPFILLKTENLEDVCRFLRDDERTAFDMLHCLSGVESTDCFESVYHLFSLKHKHIAILKVRAAKINPSVPSVVSIWRAANWHERESYDLMGIKYEGHPDLTRILLGEGWEGHPLRKDYKMPEHDRLKELGF